MISWFMVHDSLFFDHPSTQNICLCWFLLSLSYDLRVSVHEIYDTWHVVFSLIQYIYIYWFVASIQPDPGIWGYGSFLRIRRLVSCTLSVTAAIPISLSFHTPLRLNQNMFLFLGIVVPVDGLHGPDGTSDQRDIVIVDMSQWLWIYLLVT